ncbi:MAG: methylmalonyl-CoA mutase [Acidimicrobiaceae bacterium]|nr:methylmalonyl-CoA mutase [Acidimicrobiaceae bacterium]
MPRDAPKPQFDHRENIPPADSDYESWAAAASSSLSHKNLDELTTSTFDGIERLPLYTRQRNGTRRNQTGLPGESSFARGSRASGNILGWEVRQSHFSTRKGVNDHILADLENGATAITLKGAPESPDALRSVLAGVYFDLAPVHLSPGSSITQASALLEVCADDQSHAELLRNNLGFDPVGRLARTGHSVLGLDEGLAECAETASQLSVTFPKVTPVSIDGSVWADAGASDTQELGAVLSAGVLWIRTLMNSGLGINDISSKIELTLSAGPDQFLTTAKIRAARICWARIVKACGGNPSQSPLFVHVETSRSMMTKTDSWVNMLRSTAACFAAAVGGADAITVAPFDSASGLSNETGLRLARNTQLILQEETKLCSVIDPAGGSWYIEELTDHVALSSWEIFQELERCGGLDKALLSGQWQASIAQTRDKRLEALSDRSTPLTGTSEFPNLDELELEREPLPEETTTLGEKRCEPLPLFRWSAPFEQMREAAEFSSDRPLLFLANLGGIATHAARSAFAKNLFESGGIRVADNDGFDTPSACAEAFSSSGCRIACICSSNDVYSESALEVARQLRSAGAEQIYLAGTSDLVDGHRGEIDDFVYLGCNVLDALTPIHQLLTR